MAENPVLKIFYDIFCAEPLVVRSPLPVRLLGEYNPYNDGWILSTTVNKYVTVAAGRRDDSSIQLFSVQHLEKIEVAPTDLIDVNKTGWAKVILTVLNHIHRAGYAIPGVNIMIDTTGITEGLAYTTALEAALYIALNDLFHLQLSNASLGSLARETFDSDFHICLFGKRGYALKLDTRSFTHEYIPLRLTDYSLVSFIMANRSSVSVQVYRDRLCACEEVLFHLKKTDNQIQTLRDCSLPLVYSYILNADIRRRAAFIVRENTRVVAASTNLQAGNFKAFGQRLSESDDGLIAEYEIGSPEPDWLMDELGWNENVAGSRRLTGTFRNAAFSLIRAGKLEEITNNLAKAFENTWNKKLMVEVLMTAPGTELLKADPDRTAESNNRFK